MRFALFDGIKPPRMKSLFGIKLHTDIARRISGIEAEGNTARREKEKSKDGNDSGIKMLVGLVMAVIGVYIGVALIPGIKDATESPATPSLPATIQPAVEATGVAGLVSVVLIVVAAVIIFMVIKVMGNK